jgi:hypothetical protein
VAAGDRDCLRADLALSLRHKAMEVLLFQGCGDVSSADLLAGAFRVSCLMVLSPDSSIKERVRRAAEGAVIRARELLGTGVGGKRVVAPGPKRARERPRPEPVHVGFFAGGLRTWDRPS